MSRSVERDVRFRIRLTAFIVLLFVGVGVWAVIQDADLPGEAVGTVVKRSALEAVGPSPNHEIEFVVDERTYTVTTWHAYRDRTGWRGEVGDEVVVRYDPSDPSVNYVEGGKRRTGEGWSLVVAALGFGGWSAIEIARRRRRAAVGSRRMPANRQTPSTRSERRRSR